MGDDRSFEERLRDAEAALERLRAGEAPSPDELADAPLLDRWFVVAVGGLCSLSGRVYGHPDLPDDRRIVTSNLLWLAGDGTAARTISRFYRLGRRYGDRGPVH